MQVKSVFWICLCGVLAGFIRCHNLQEVLVDGRIYFLDADCYSRMTRARLIMEAPGRVRRWHDFENHPAGVDSHTTAPFDYCIIGIKSVLDFGFLIGDRARTHYLGAQTLDLAGALISPLLGVATCLWLGIWARQLPTGFRNTEGAPRSAILPWIAGSVPLFFAISPILVHGTALGRPDHQSLLIMLLAISLSAELRLASGASRRWSVTSGLAWGLALWVSLYEPLVLFAAVIGLWLVLAPRRLLARERIAGLCVFVALSLIAFAIEGWRIHAPEQSTLPFLKNWSESLGELKHPTAGMIFGWLGWGCLAAPVLLVITSVRDRTAIPILLVLLLVVALTCWQLRWGYFLALVFGMSLPWQLAALQRAAVGWLFFAVALWPMLQEWDERLFPSEEAQRRAAERRLEVTVLRTLLDNAFTDVAFRDSPVGFVAPWWLSPSIAYWTGHHGVAGSSHESLPGIMDSARFYLAEDPQEAGAILKTRRVAWVLADDPGRVVGTSSAILGVTPPSRPMAFTLAERPQQAPAFLIEKHPVDRLASRAAAEDRDSRSGLPPGGPRLYRIYLVEGANVPNE